MPAAERGGGRIADKELAALFSDFTNHRRVILAVSGGPDSTALLVLAHKWRRARTSGPELIAATVDHRLRRESRREAAMVAKLAAAMRLPHHTLVWSGKKPKSGLQEAAREARYGLLCRLARSIGADAIATAHTLDDQAETVLMRIARGSGLAGLAGIGRRSSREGIALLRPLLLVPKSRLVATLRAARIPFVDDPSNLDPRFTRVRLRRMGAELAREGIDAGRLALLAQRIARADAALDAAADEVLRSMRRTGGFESTASDFFALPDEIAIRVLKRTIDEIGSEGPAELGKLERLHSALTEAKRAGARLKRTLAGAAVSLTPDRLVVERAPVRRKIAATVR